MGRVHVAHLEARAFALEPALAERRDAALVRDLGQRVVLVHELRQLRGAEELLDRRGHRLRVDHVLRVDLLVLRERQALLDRALDAHEADAECDLGHLADAAHAAVAEVVDVVHLAVAVLDRDQRAQHVDHVGHVRAILGDESLSGIVLALVGNGREIASVIEDARLLEPALRFGARKLRRELAVHAAVELHAAHRRQVVALAVEEQVVEQVLGGVLRRRLARAHHPVDLDQRLEARRRRVDPERVRNVRAAVEVVDVQRPDFRHVGVHETLHQRGRQRVVRIGKHFAGRRIGDFVSEDLALEVFDRHVQAAHARFLELAHVARGDPAPFLDDDLAVRADLEHCDLAAQALGHELELGALLCQVDGVVVEEEPQDVGVRVAERTQQDGDRELAAAVDAREHAVLRVELEVEPGAAVRDHARLEQELAGAVGLALVVVEDHARAAVQLGHDHALGAVDDEGAVLGHERQLAEVDLLLDRALHARGARGLLVHDAQPQADAERRGVGQPAHLAFLDVEHRLAEVVVDVLERRMARIALDREHAVECGVQARAPQVLLDDALLLLLREQPAAGDLAARVRGQFRVQRTGLVQLQELRVRVGLDREQRRHVQNALALAKVFPDALLLGERIGHLHHLVPVSAKLTRGHGRAPPPSREAARPCPMPRTAGQCPRMEVVT